jgi:hypothetical protein
MAAIEQLVFGPRIDGKVGRDVLACSPGLEADCAQELVGLCEGWGRVPTEGVRRQVLLSSPLESRPGSIPGRFYAVIRVGTGLKPVYHALVLSEDGFAEFAYDPFAVARAEAFVDTVGPRQIVTRREIVPRAVPAGDLTPQRTDSGFVDEALRQLLVNRRLELPLEIGSEESDRFLNLLICCLPGPLRRDLRFASWTPGGRNACTLAAVQRDAAFFRSWRPYLMSLPLGQLTASAQEYVAQVRSRLESGDLDGLAQLSQSALVELGVRATVRPGTLGATVPPPGEPVRRTPSPPRLPRPVIGDQRPSPSRDIPRAAARSRPPQRQSETNARRRLVVLVVVGLLVAGVYKVWHTTGWQGLTAIGRAPGVNLYANANYGILDVARLHDDALRATAPGHPQEALRQAAQLLDTQAQVYLDQVGATLATGGRGDIHAITEALPADKLADKGERLADELRRLALADVSLLEGTRWRDLGTLDRRQLTARHDSVLAARGGVLTSDIWSLADRRLGEVRTARQRVTTLDRVQSLLTQHEWRPGWERELAEAGRKLEPVRSGGAACWSAAARALARLKQAEQEVDFGSAALTLDDPTAAWRAGPVAAALPEVRRALASFGGQNPPALLAATVRFYDDLARGWAQAEDTPPDQLAALIRGFEQNPAVAFDRAAYADHVCRLGVAVVQGLRARGLAAEAVPEVIFPGGRREETLSFLAAAGEGRDSAGWHREAAAFQEPFFARWAARLARQADATRVARSVAFETTYAQLAVQARALAATIARREDAAVPYRELCAAAALLQRDHPDGFAGEPELNRRWRRVEALRAALSSSLPLSLADVTLRLDQGTTDGSPVLVEFEAGGRRSVSAPVVLSPAAPAGSGWVGTTAVNWRVVPATGERLSVRVLRAADRTALVTLDYGPWLEESGPAILERFQPGDGGRIAWRLGADYWSELRLPALD